MIHISKKAKDRKVANDLRMAKLDRLWGAMSNVQRMHLGEVLNPECIGLDIANFAIKHPMHKWGSVRGEEDDKCLWFITGTNEEKVKENCEIFFYDLFRLHDEGEYNRNPECKRLKKQEIKKRYIDKLQIWHR